MTPSPTMAQEASALHDSEDDLRDFVAKLEHASTLPRKCSLEAAARKSVNTVTTATGPLEISNWKFDEFDYSRRPEKMATHARGLFTVGNKIVARGYNKFFNLGDPANKEDQLRNETQGPYNVSVKENGCIIFLSGLEDGTLLVCSKNATGDRIEGKLVHYQQGRTEIEKQLSGLGTTPEALAKVLHAMDVTAVAELCDDEFQEHILEYPRELAGLYLHGLNYNTIEFNTKPMDEVNRFASQWGFKEVKHLKFNTFDETLKFLNEAGETGSYDNREVEGFVVRCMKKDTVFFFKFKFEQPYFLYRQLREATNALFNPDVERKMEKEKLTEDEMEDARTKRVSQVIRRYPEYQRITLHYLLFVRELFAQHPEKKEQFLNDVGVIKVRKMFLKKLGFEASEWRAALLMEDDAKLSDQLAALVPQGVPRYFIITIAPIGCGKTTTCNILNHLFPDWVHVQNDDSTATTFINKGLEALNKHQVVFMDRTNLRAANRLQLFEALEMLRWKHLDANIDVRYIGLNFLKSEISDEAKTRLEERVLARGDNHQSIHAETQPKGSLEHVRNFVRMYESPKMANGEELPPVVEGSALAGSDKQFSLLVNVDADEEDSSLKNAKFLLQALADRYPDIETRTIPELEWDAAFDMAKKYQPKNRKVVSSSGKKAVYFGINIDPQLVWPVLEAALKDDPTWESLQASNRVQEHFHITLAHTNFKARGDSQAEIARKEKTWQELSRAFQVKVTGKTATQQERRAVEIYGDIQVESILVVEKRLIAVGVKLNQCYEKAGGEFKKIRALSTTNNHLHVTIGTAGKEIAPRMSNKYLLDFYSAYPDAKEGSLVITEGTEEVKILVFKAEAIFTKQRGFIQF